MGKEGFCCLMPLRNVHVLQGPQCCCSPSATKPLCSSVYRTAQASFLLYVLSAENSVISVPRQALYCLQSHLSSPREEKWLRLLPSRARPRPWPAAPAQPAVKRRSLPQPSERKSRGNGAQHPQAGSPPGDEELNSLRAGGQPSAQAGSASAQGTSRDTACPAPTDTTVPAAKGQTAPRPSQPLSLSQHSSSLQLYFPVFPSSTSTDSKPQEESPLFIFPLFQQVTEAAH